MKILLTGATAAAVLLAPVSGIVQTAAQAASKGKTAVEDTYIKSTSPDSGATAVVIGSKVTATFYEAMKSSTITEDSFYLVKDGSTKAISAKLSYSSSTCTATLTPKADLKEATKYVAHLTNAIKTNDGDKINSYYWSFTTASSGDGEYIASVSPKKGATGVDVASKVTVTFLDDMDEDSIDTDSFYLRKKDTTKDISAKVTYSSSSKKATLTPKADLKTSTEYEVYVDSDIETEDGDSINDYSWTFKTGSSSGDDDDEYIKSTSPDNGDKNVDVDDNITVKFTEEMDSDTIKKSSFFVKKKNSSIEVKGKVSYSSSSKTATFKPSSDLSYSTEYTVTLTSDISTEDGDSISKYTFKFKTENDPDD